MKIKWGNAVEVWGNDNLDALDERVSLVDQRLQLSEDIAYAKYSNGSVIDIGYYREDGLTVSVIDSGGWYDPKWRGSCEALSELQGLVDKAKAIVRSTLTAR